MGGVHHGCVQATDAAIYIRGISDCVDCLCEERLIKPLLGGLKSSVILKRKVVTRDYTPDFFATAFLSAEKPVRVSVGEAMVGPSLGPCSLASLSQ